MALVENDWLNLAVARKEHIGLCKRTERQAEVKGQASQSCEEYHRSQRGFGSEGSQENTRIVNFAEPEPVCH